MAEFKKEKSLAPVQSQSVVDTTIRRIVDAVSDGTYKIGEKLPNEYELIKELKISRNSLREAMRVLSTIGIVEIRRGDGTYVCDQVNPSIVDNMIYGLVFDTSSTDELVELRQSLDEIMLRLAIQKADNDDIVALTQHIEAMETNFNNGNLKAVAIADYNFHIRLVEAAKNKFLIRIVKGIYQLFKHSIFESIVTDEEFAHAVEYHKQLLNLITTRDSESVSKVVETTLDNWQHHIK